jgi:hypothetical protein
MRFVSRIPRRPDSDLKWLAKRQAYLTWSLQRSRKVFSEKRQVFCDREEKCGGPTQKKKLFKLLAVEEGGGGFLGGPYSASLVAD